MSIIFLFSGGTSYKKRGAQEVETPLTAEEEAFFDEENDEDFEDNGEEDLELTGVVEEEEQVPTKSVEEQAAKKMPAAKKSSSKKATVDALSNSMGKMSISKKFSMSFRCPCVILDHVVNGRDIATVELLIPNVHRRWIKLKVSECGKCLHVAIVVPGFFCDPRHVMAANADDGDFTHNASQATRFQRMCKEVMKTADDDEKVWEDPQVIPLPFAVEQQFFAKAGGDNDGWQVDLCDNDDSTLVAELGGHTDFFVLTVNMMSTEKPLPVKSKGRMRRVTTAPSSSSTGGKRDRSGSDDSVSL